MLVRRKPKSECVTVQTDLGHEYSWIGAHSSGPDEFVLVRKESNNFEQVFWEASTGCWWPEQWLEIVEDAPAEKPEFKAGMVVKLTKPGESADYPWQTGMYGFDGKFVSLAECTDNDKYWRINESPTVWWFHESCMTHV